jgi:hypothetical protein
MTPVIPPKLVIIMVSQKVSPEATAVPGAHNNLVALRKNMLIARRTSALIGEIFIYCRNKGLLHLLNRERYTIGL